ncbi:MAG: hypothetical protein ABL921_25215 [Pirellula sp.]
MNTISSRLTPTALWLIKRIAWKLQANAEGDISERALRLAHQIAMATDIRTSLPRVTRRETVDRRREGRMILSVLKNSPASGLKPPACF